MTLQQDRKIKTKQSAILLVDDDPAFLHKNAEFCREYHQDKAEIFTLNPEQGEDPVAWIAQRLSAKRRLDAVFLDENMVGKNGGQILDEIRALRQARHLPIAMMTQYADKVREAEALDSGAARYIYKTRDGKEAYSFLQEALDSLNQLRDHAEDAMWMELLHEVSLRGQSLEKEVGGLVDYVATFLSEYFGESVTYVRERNEETLSLLGTHDPYKAGRVVPMRAVLPYASPLLNRSGPLTVRKDSLSESEVRQGRLRRLIGSRFVGVPLLLNGERIGMLTLYRPPDRHPFRRKDESFLQHLALEITSRLGTRRILTQLRERQTQLARFVREMTDAKSEKDACDSLVRFLHKEVHGNDDTQTKTTVRLLQPSGKIRPVTRLGIPSSHPDEDMDIYRGLEPGESKSVYVEVIRSRKSVRYTDVTAADVLSQPGLHARLTVPLLSSGLCLGAVNLEHERHDSYSKEDQEFAEAVAGLTAHALVNLKAQRFINGLLDLVNDLVQPDPVSTEEVLVQSFALLHELTGSAALLYFVPPEGSGWRKDAWQVIRVIDDKGAPPPNMEVEDWQKHSTENWTDTFIYKTLASDRRYTEDATEIAQDRTKTQAMEVVHLGQQTDGAPTGIIALLFRLPGAINPFLREQLNTFSQFIGALIATKGNIKRLLDQKSLAEQEAVLGQVLGQFRHSLRGRLGLLGNALSKAERMGMTGDWLQRARDILSEIDEEIDHSRNFVKAPEYQDFLVDEVWKRVMTKLGALAEKHSVNFLEVYAPQQLSWRSDPDIVSLILENLVLNAVQKFQDCPGGTVGLRVIPSEDTLCLTVFDSGPSVPESIRPRLFQPGVTSKATGTGFGLRFSRLRARDLQGDLRFEPDHRPGAAFSLLLPQNPKV